MGEHRARLGAHPAWYLYVVRCSDNTIYAGISTDVDRRVHAHNHRACGARYTRTRRPVVLVTSALAGDSGDALRAERAFKMLDRAEKLRVIVEGTLQRFVDSWKIATKPWRR